MNSATLTVLFIACFKKFLCKLFECHMALLYIPWLALRLYFELELSYRLIS